MRVIKVPLKNSSKCQFLGQPTDVTTKYPFVLCAFYSVVYLRQVQLSQMTNHNHHQWWDLSLTDSRHHHHGQIPTIVGICDGGSKLPSLDCDYCDQSIHDCDLK